MTLLWSWAGPEALAAQRNAPAMKVGLLVNPIAGMGGRVGLHGTDGSLWRESLVRGATPVAATRARRALDRLATRSPDCTIITGAGELGEDVVRQVGLDLEVITPVSSEPTPSDSHRLLSALLDQPIELLLFAGGDGTARDVLAHIGDHVPVVGIPTGVKMRSAVFARTPEDAGDLAAHFLRGDRSTNLAEVADASAPGAWDQEVHGHVRVPTSGGRLQPMKNISMGNADADLRALQNRLAQDLEPGRLYLLGPGLSTAGVAEALGLPSSHVGVDALLDGASLGTDLSEQQILTLLEAHTNATLILGVVGGQGFLLGRGNQQLSAEVLRRIGSTIVIAHREKITALQPPKLWIDIDDALVASQLQGYRRVLVGPDEEVVMEVLSTGSERSHATV